MFKLFHNTEIIFIAGINMTDLHHDIIEQVECEVADHHSEYKGIEINWSYKISDQSINCPVVQITVLSA